MNYRTAPETPATPPRVVRYRPSSLRDLAPVLFGLCLAGLVLLGLAARFLRSVDLRCQRAAGSCVIEVHWLLFTENRRVPLVAIEGTVMMGDKKNGFDVAFITVDPKTRESTNIVLPHGGNEPIEVRTEQKLQVDGFLADPSKPSLELAYSKGSLGFGVVPILFSLAMIYAVVYLTQGARFEADVDHGKVRIVQERWPLPARVVTLTLAEVVSVGVLDVPNPKRPGSSWNVEIFLADGTKQLLASAAGTTRARAEMAARDIGVILKDRPATE